MQDARDLVIPSIVFYELQMGVERMRRQDHEKSIELDSWITNVANAFTILPLSSEEARLTALLMQKHSPLLLADAMIAATAIRYDMPIATRNTRDFADFPVQIVNPFQFR